MAYSKPTNLTEARENTRYHGKILVSAGGEVHGTYDEAQAQKLYKRLQRKYPQDSPVTTIIPKGPVVLLPVQLSHHG